MAYKETNKPATLLCRGYIDQIERRNGNNGSFYIVKIRALLGDDIVPMNCTAGGQVRRLLSLEFDKSVDGPIGNCGLGEGIYLLEITYSSKSRTSISAITRTQNLRDFY